MNTKTAIFGLHEAKKNMTLKEKYDAVGGNTGNIIFDTALYNLIDADRVYWDSTQDIIDQYDQFITTSYIWIRQNQEIPSAIDRVGDKPFIPMSVGLQANNYDPNFVLHPKVVKDLKRMAERCIIGCRGEYTAEILQKYGIKNTMIIGCPSIYMGLYSSNKVEKNLSNEPHNIVTNFSTFWRKLKSYETDFLYYAAKHNFAFIEQTSNVFQKEYWDEKKGDFNFISNWLKNKKIFFSYTDWLDEIKNYDFAIGYRFHGNVIAVNNGIPALFIYSDSRVQELCDFFKLPMIKANDFSSSKPLDFWYDKADYSEFNKLIPSKKLLFEEFCKKNNILMRSQSIDNGDPKKSIVPILQEQTYKFSKHWLHIEFENTHIFQSDGETCQHLSIKLPQKLRKHTGYCLKFRMKFKTNNTSVRLFLADTNDHIWQIYTIRNKRIDDYYDICLSVKCADKEFCYLCLTSSDFSGSNYLAISKIKIEETFIIGTIN